MFNFSIHLFNYRPDVSWPNLKMYHKLIPFYIALAVLAQNLIAQELEKPVRTFTLASLEAAIFSSNPELQYYEQEIEAAKQGSKTAGAGRTPA